MIQILLDAIPNQSFTINLDQNSYAITIKEARGIMAADIVRNGEVLLSGARIVAGTPLIPYQYQENGNFVILTENELIPYYLYFGISQTLIYASQAEIEAALNANA